MTRRCRVSGVSSGSISTAFLQQDLSAVRDFVDKMHRRPRDLYAPAQGGLVYLQAVHPLAAERRDQGGMDIQNPFRPLRGKRRAEDGEEARQNDKVDLMRGQLFGEPGTQKAS